MKNQTLYRVTTQDVINVSKEIGVKYSVADFDFLKDKIGDYFGSQWYDAVEYALRSLRGRNL